MIIYINSVNFVRSDFSDTKLQISCIRFTLGFYFNCMKNQLNTSYIFLDIERIYDVRQVVLYHVFVFID